MADKKSKPAASGKKIRVTLVKGLRAHQPTESVKGLGLSTASTVRVEGFDPRNDQPLSYLLKVEG
jgi:hypothetical protein